MASMDSLGNVVVHAAFHFDLDLILTFAEGHKKLQIFCRFVPNGYHFVSTVSQKLYEAQLL